MHRINLNSIFKKDRDLKIGYAIVDLMKQRDEIENFNKKALYILIREMTGSKTQHITRIVNVMKKYNTGLMKEFQNTGQLDTADTGSFL